MAPVPGLTRRVQLTKSDGVDIFTKRGITPPWEADGGVARAQGFERYEGADWTERRAFIAEREPLYGQDEHPDPGKGDELWRRKVEAVLSPFGPNAVAKYPDAGFTPTPEVAGKLERARLRLPQSARQSWTYWLRRVLATDGWLMPRHAIMPDHLDSDFAADPVAQLGPTSLPFWRRRGTKRITILMTCGRASVAHMSGRSASWRPKDTERRSSIRQAPSYQLAICTR